MVARLGQADGRSEQRGDHRRYLHSPPLGDGPVDVDQRPFFPGVPFAVHALEVGLDVVQQPLGTRPRHIVERHFDQGAHGEEAPLHGRGGPGAGE